MIPDRGDLVWLNFNPQSGHEQAGRRPALVVSPKQYNEISNCVIVCPITSNASPWPWKVNVTADNGISGMVLVDQVKSVDREARQLELTGQRVSMEVLLETIGKLQTLTGV